MKARQSEGTTWQISKKEKLVKGKEKEEERHRKRDRKGKKGN